MSDTPTNPSTIPSGPLPNSTVSVGFLTILQETAGLVGGYLLTNHWGRPLEFRHSTAIQANRVHEILYGPTLAEYLHADLIGKTLIEKSSTRPSLIVTDSLPALALAARVELPVLAILRNAPSEIPQDRHAFQHPRSRVPLLAASIEAYHEILPILDRLDPSIDLLEPFTRLQEALLETRKLGANQRAA